MLLLNEFNASKFYLKNSLPYINIPKKPSQYSGINANNNNAGTIGNTTERGLMMKDRKIAKGSLCLALILCLTVLSSTFVSAGSMVNPLSASSDGKRYLEEAVIKLMEEGKLTEQKVEKILEYKKRRLEELKKSEIDNKQRKRGSLLRDMIKEGIITEQEAQLIKTKLKEMKEARLQGGLQELVDRGVLTGKDIDNIRSYMLKIRKEREQQLEKLRSMTPAERKEFYENSKRDRKDIITRMVEDKVITEEQAKEIKKAIPELDKPGSKKAE